MNTLWFILLIGVLIFVHELGHFVVAKACGVKVLRFSLGFGPPIVSFTRGETEYVVAWLPLGGFVSMLGADPSEDIEPEDRDRAYFAQPLWQRFAIALAGPAMNLVFPVAIYFVFFYSQTTLPPAAVGTVFADTPAAAAGLKPGDRIVRIGDVPIRYWTDLQGLVSQSADQRLEIEVERQGERIVTSLTPSSQEIVSRSGRKSKVGRMGIAAHFLGSHVGVLGASSPAAQAGLQTFDRVVAVDGVSIDRWYEVERALAGAAGRRLRLRVVRDEPIIGEALTLHTGRTLELELTVPGDGKTGTAGLYPGEHFALEVDEGTPFWGAGMRAGDMLVSADDTLCPTWDACISWMVRRPEETHVVGFIRGAEPEAGIQHAPVRVEFETRIGDYREERRVPVLGARNRTLLVAPEPIKNEARLAYAAVNSVTKNLEVVSVTAYGFVMMLRGDISTKSLGGPIMIYNIAGKAAEKGWDEYLWVMALISINLGLINLLPIPMLDGGHLLFVLIEAVKRGPISLRTRAIATYVGLSFLIFLMLFAFKNDIERYWEDITSLFR